MRHSLTVEKFKANSDNVLAVRDFLKSDLGQTIMAVLEASHPLRQVGDAKLNKSTNIRQAAAGVADGGAGRAENILGRIEGYESALDTLISLSEFAPEKVKKSTKAGREIAPAQLPTN